MINKKNTKRSIALHIFVVLIISGLYSNNLNQQPAGDGEKNSPYHIETIENLLWLSNNPDKWDKHFIQTADIDASETKYWNEAKGWMPIGNDSIAFTGTYNGKNHIISGLYINRPDQNNVGLFGFVSNNNSSGTKETIIRNIGLLNTHITGNNAVGSLIGSVSGDENTIIEYCFASMGSVKGIESVGGLIGKINSHSVNETKGPVLKHSYVIINVKLREDIPGKKEKTGGLVGSLNKGKINNCFTRGSITAKDGSKIGGIAGYINYYSRINHTYTAMSFNLMNCEQVGGIAGYNDYTCNNEKNIANSYWDLETSGICNYVNTDKTNGKTTKEMKNAFTYKGWFNKSWNIKTKINSGYPYIDFYNTSPQTILAHYDVIQNNKYVIIEWITIAENNNKYFTVEKTTDGHFFETIAYTSGNNSSSNLNFYRIMDTNPGSRNAIYRLTQTGVNGEKKIFPSMTAPSGVEETKDKQLYISESFSTSF